MDVELPLEARALLDAVVAIGSDLDLRGVLSRIVETACELTGAEYGVLGIVDEQGRFTELVPNATGAEAFRHIKQMPQGHGLLGLVPRERRTIRVDHVEDHPAHSHSMPGKHPPIDSFLGAPVLVRDEAFGHLYLGNKRGGATFTTTDQALVEALAQAAAVMIDNARTYEQVEWRRRWLATSAEIGNDPTRPARVHEVLDELVESLRELCSARVVAAVWQENQLMEVRAASGEHDLVTAMVDDLGDELRGVTETGTPRRIPVSPGVATIVVPVPTRLAGTGVIVVEHARETPSLRGVMLELAAVSGVQLGLILDREQALRDRAQLLVAKDRDRIARDLHDLVIQRLFATGMQLQGGRGLDVLELRSRVDGAIGDLDIAIKELRAAIFELGAGPVKPLLEEVRSLLSEYAVVLGFQPVLRISGQVDRALTSEANTHALTTLREALSNVARHAEARSVVVEMSATSAWFRLRVIDDGVGFDPHTAPSGHGSSNLRSRAAELGGHLQVTSAPGAGTTLEWVIPAIG
ncbi:GAF domain-containing protein [Nocardioides sp. zg-536]|uniref:GAF domain-containing protein n=1 Tax=Nocardioides faecalis TaxID=2803858 RepID=A0A938Y408_9ACTN|nr:GAF domain-containing protein [Nocardioides faecalis]MBM9461476.1 GAF domain-containing protein [Nocardioides faecalis]QVI59337.1 GAF domain-containing protein [Nocardioides faecalis]